jgi:hypothetical protein
VPLPEVIVRKKLPQSDREQALVFLVLLFLNPGNPNKHTRERQEQSIDCSMEGSRDAYPSQGKIHPSNAYYSMFLVFLHTPSSSFIYIQSCNQIDHCNHQHFFSFTVVASECLAGVILKIQKENSLKFLKLLLFWRNLKLIPSPAISCEKLFQCTTCTHTHRQWSIRRRHRSHRATRPTLVKQALPTAAGQGSQQLHLIMDLTCTATTTTLTASPSWEDGMMLPVLLSQLIILH